MGERPGIAVRNAIASAVTLTAATGVDWVVKNSTPKDQPDRAIWVWATGGGALIPIQSSALENIRFPVVQIIVRGQRGDDAAVIDLVRDIRDALDRTPPTDYIDVTANQPIHMMPDNNDRPRQSLNVDLTIIE